MCQPEADGVAALLEHHGFRSAYDVAEANNFAGRAAPPMTHWTGTTVDFAYLRDLAPVASQVLGTYVCFTPLSDHLPVIVDLKVA